jgi:hemolysin III
MTVSAAAPRQRPRLRGVSHQFAAFVASGAGLSLVAMAPSPRAAAACAVYAITLALMFGTSAVYHRVTWSPPARARMRRLDHAAIFLIIAGTYTPLAVLAIGGAAGTRLLLLVWAGALAGVLRATVWPHAPRVVAVALYVALGWLALAYLGELHAGVGAAGIALILAGGVFYTAGGVIYALRRPDPLPRVFGYHEIFHALTIAASVCHFAAVLLVVRAAN